MKIFFFLPFFPSFHFYFNIRQGCRRGFLFPRTALPIVSGEYPLRLQYAVSQRSFSAPPPSSQPMEKHNYLLLCASMEWPLYVAVFKNTFFLYNFYLIKKCQYPYGIFICPAPYWQGVCRAGWLVLFIVQSRERFPLPARPPACCSGCPHRAEVSLWLPLGLPATRSPAPDAACCLPSPVTVFRFTPMGRQIMAKLIVQRNLFKGMPLKAAAYWYLVFKFPTFRRKACNKHKGLHGIFLLIKAGIFPHPYPSLQVSGCLFPNSAMSRQKSTKIKDAQRILFL